MGKILSNKDFIVKFSQAYNNEKEISGLKLVMNLDVNNADYLNRECTVIALPYNYSGDIKVGDTLIVHHNVARIAINNDGSEIQQNKIRQDLFRCSIDLIFLYRSDVNDEWKSHGEFIFVSPIENTLVEKIGSIIIPSFVNEKYENNVGIVSIESLVLNELGVKKGDKIYFKDFSDHKYTIDDKLLYKMNVNRVLGLVID